MIYQGNPMLIQRILVAAAILWCLICGGTETKAQDEVATNLNVAVQEHLSNDDVDKALAALSPIVSTDAITLGAKDDQGLSVAAGAIYRKLNQLSTDEQFDLLHTWSLPIDGQGPVKMISSFVPQSAPPKAFARGIGERPRDNTFSISAISGVRGIFCSGWMLVKAADDIGRLGPLTTELEGLVEKETPGANILLTLAQVAARRGDSATAKSTLERRLERLEAQPLEDSTDFLIAVAAIGNDALRPIAAQILEKLSAAIDQRPHHERAFLRIAHAVALQTQFGTSEPKVLYKNPLKYWVPADTTTSQSNKRGMPQSMWLAHENHVLHLGGPLNNLLICRFPMTEDFTFGCDVQDGDEPEMHGGLVYGGLQFEPHGKIAKLRVSASGRSSVVDRNCPHVRRGGSFNFNRLTLESTKKSILFAVNHQPTWSDPKLDQNSPWIGLRSDGRRRPAFRNFVVFGSPTIPQEIPLLEASDLRGWTSNFFYETLTPFHPDAKPVASDTNFDWIVQNGELQSSTRIVHGSARKQSLLRYQRPLLDGESISYEFFYEADKTQVHPALGRIAFLVEENGIRVRWITDGPNEWTGLAEDNSILEPLSRRGPRKSPLRTGWNQLTIAIGEGNASLTLNGELVYQRPVEANQSQTFGLYRDPAKTAVRVRNVVMTGNWPKELPKDFLQNPTATRLPEID